jgi:lipopolysaccharide transport protein LptA
MKKKEIYLDKPLGYDVNYERQIAFLVKTLGTRPQSIFTLAKEYKKGLGYWFQAKNLSWKLADQMLFCTGGILLNKGEITGFADTLRGDVEFKKVLLEGNPRIEILSADRSPITFEAQIFELSSTQNLFIAHGNPRVTWQEANLFSDSASYFQTEQKMALDGNVKINYKDILAWGNSASYLTEKQNVILSGDARAEQGDNKLSGDKVLVSLKENKISVLGKSRVVISGEKIKP